MAGPVANHQILRFGTFELDCTNRELRREGVLIKLTPQQWKLLRFLAENPGRVLTREEIQHQIWGNDTFVDFQRNLNVCMAQLRAALNDDSESPRFIQTLPRQGYRFVAPVSSAGTAKPLGETRTIRRRVIAFCAASVLCVAVAGFFAFRYAAHSQPTRVAVLPFESLDPNAQDDSVLDGMTEELISELGSQSARVNVLGRSSIMRYKGALARRDNAGRELDADYVVEGSVRREGTITRITARLVRVKDQVQIWSNSFEQDGGNPFELEETVAARVTAGVLSNLLSEPKPAVRQTHTPSRAASQAYLNGRYLQHKANLADLRRSVQYFAAATEADASFASAQAALAETYVLLARSGAAPPEEFKKARSAAESALRLDASNAEAHNALANALFWHEWVWPEAEREFRQALTINASFAAAHHDLAFFLVAMGRR